MLSRHTVMGAFLSSSYIHYYIRRRTYYIYIYVAYKSLPHKPVQAMGRRRDQHHMAAVQGTIIRISIIYISTRACYVEPSVGVLYWDFWAIITAAWDFRD